MPEPISSELAEALSAFASEDTILIALDFDGTLAPLVDDPETSRMIAPAREALEKLTPVPGVTIALVTGRAIDSVKRVAEPLNEWFLAGSHGIEVLSPGEATGYETPWLVPIDLIKNFEAVVRAHPGTRLEQKPFGLALHTRGVEEQLARHAEAAAQKVCDAWAEELVVRTGHGIVECSIHEATKGDGINEIRRRVNPTAVLFAGDDRTDEDGFAVLVERDLGIRVGGGRSIAPYQLDDAYAVAQALWFIYGER
ncbi:MAG TPA: trehalose-phosphatase, partial [Pontimonas sp.]|nr:trehalose-phosphatase [Pontimonas sp.]